MGKLIKNDGINKIKIVLDFHSSENNQKDSFFSDKEGNPISDKIVTSIFQIIAKFKNTFELNKFIKLLLQEDNVTKTYTQTVLNIVKEELNSSMINF